MAAVMLAGAPLANEAFAAGFKNPTADFVLPQALASGVKFNAAQKLSLSADESYYYFSDSGTTDNYTFTIKNYANYTFGLVVKGKPVYYLTDGGVKVGTFVAKNTDGYASATNFTSIEAYQFNQAGVPVGTTWAPKTQSLTLDEEDLNANFSGKGFKLSFPGVAVQPGFNPFADQMVALDAAKVAHTLGLITDAQYTDPDVAKDYHVVFALANEAGKKALAEPTKANLEAATFIAVSPYTNFGITGLSAYAGEGYDFTTVKGDKLKSENKKADGYISICNAAFEVTEHDQLNAADEYIIAVDPLVAQGTDENVDPADDGDSVDELEDHIYVGTYALTAAGEKSYVTTVTAGWLNDLTLASTAGNSYAVASDVLKSSKEAAIYNIFFQGPAEHAGAATSYYGKYLMNGGSVKAPAKMNKNLSEALWVITKVENKGVVTFANLYDSSNTYEMKLYKTAEAGVYQTNAFAGNDGAGLIKLIPNTEAGSFLSLSDSEQERVATIVFKGTGDFNVSSIYPTIADGAVSATKDADYKASWYISKVKDGEKTQTVNFAYLNGSSIKTDGKAETKIPTYILKDAASGKQLVSNLEQVVAANTQEATFAQFAIKKNTNGTYSLIKADTYANMIAATAEVLNVNLSTSKLQLTTVAAGSAYNTVTIAIAELGESLPAVSRHATFEGIDGGISAAVDAKGITHAIIAAEPLTFWLDTAESKAETPKFYISFGIADDEEEEVETKADEEAEVRMFLYTPSDSIWTWDADKAEKVENKNYYNAVKDTRAIYRPAALVAVDTIATLQGNKEVLVSKKAATGVVAGLEKFQFAITKTDDGDYVITNYADKYLYNLNGVLAFTDKEDNALVVTVGEGDPTANEAIEAESGIEVIGGQGVVTVQGAAGKVITVANILGQTIANQVAASDNVTIAAPAGIVVVSVDGEATKVIVK